MHKNYAIFIYLFFVWRIELQTEQKKQVMKRIMTTFKSAKYLAFTAIFLFASAKTLAQVPWFSHPSEQPRGAFGSDTRAEAKSKWEYKDYMRATATAVYKSQVDGERIYTLNLKSFINQVFGNYPIDKDVRFLDQPTAGFCTGFLIAPDILVTAGHCIQNEEDLKNAVWIFDYTADVPYNEKGGYINIPEENQYYGVEILDTRLSNDRLYDYCVIRLNKKTNRKPYKFRTGGAISFNDMIAMIGSPSGLPLKVADSAHATNVDDYSTSFLTDLDAFHGNSGGPVFNLFGFIEGILVRGPGNDYHYDEESGTIKADSRWDLYYYFGMQAAMGNGVHRITSIPQNLLTTAVYGNIENAIDNNNLDEFKEWIIYSWIWKKENQLAGKDNLLALVAKAGREDFLLEILGTETVDVNTTDIFGTPLLHLLAQKNMHRALAKALEIENCDKNILDRNGETALMVAARAGSLEAVSAMIQGGANVKAKNADGKNARAIAKKAHHKDIAKLIKKAEKLKK